MSKNTAKATFVSLTTPREDRLLRHWTKLHADGKAIMKTSMECFEDVRTTILEREFPDAETTEMLRGSPQRFLGWLQGVYKIYPKRPEPVPPVVFESDM